MDIFTCFLFRLYKSYYAYVNKAELTTGRITGKKIAYYLETWCFFACVVFWLSVLFLCFRRGLSVKNDKPNDYANYHYKVRDEELPFSVLLVSFIALKEHMMTLYPLSLRKPRVSPLKWSKLCLYTCLRLKASKETKFCRFLLLKKRWLNFYGNWCCWVCLIFWI